MFLIEKNPIVTNVLTPKIFELPSLLPLCAYFSRMKILIVSTLFSLSLSVCFAQIGAKKYEELATDNEWNEGSILLNDGKELKGLVRFEDRLGIVNYINGDDSRSFTPRRVAAFEFFDPLIAKQRIYYSLEYEDPANNSKQPLFFEVLKDFKSFAVMSKVDPVKVEDRTTTTPGFSTANGIPTGGQITTTVISQTETIFFLSENGDIEPYIQVIRKVVNRERKKNKFVDREVIEKYFTADELESMRKFAEEKDLDFRVKDDFITILDYAITLRDQ
jgi:hypothetical protein